MEKNNYLEKMEEMIQPMVQKYFQELESSPFPTYILLHPDRYADIDNTLEKSKRGYPQIPVRIVPCLLCDPDHIYWCYGKKIVPEQIEPCQKKNYNYV